MLTIIDFSGLGGGAGMEGMEGTDDMGEGVSSQIVAHEQRSANPLLGRR